MSLRLFVPVENLKKNAFRTHRNHIFMAISAWLQKYQQRLKHTIFFCQHDGLIVRNSIAKNLKRI